MQTLLEKRQLDYERFEANRRFEEMTDIAERIGYPIDVGISYRMKDGAVYAASDTVERPFHSQTWQAKEAGKTKFVGDQAFEQTRLTHEHEEALLVDQLAAGKLSGNILIKVSKVPDAIVEGRTNIKGYRRDLLRSFIRIYYRTDTGAECRIFTLDHNHQPGLERVGELVGIDTARSSEIILGDYALIDRPDAETYTKVLKEQIVTAYDEAIFEATGNRTYAGSRYTDKGDAMQAISSQSTLMNQHFNAISTIVGEVRLESERERTAAAIKLAHEGADIASNIDAGVTHEVANGNYSGECATSSNGMNQAGQHIENKWSFGECQVCFVRTMVGSCAVCASCAAADDKGVDLLKIREQNLQKRAVHQEIASRALEQSLPSKKQMPSVAPRKSFDRMTIKVVKRIGGEDKIAFDSNGVMIGKV